MDAKYPIDADRALNVSTMSARQTHGGGCLDHSDISFGYAKLIIMKVGLFEYPITYATFPFLVAQTAYTTLCGFVVCLFTFLMI